ncbi:hypothetical protein [Actinomadura terrae]|uniref:hypothetical protein n=1 Tax=Actinomadura terrae TaxID=604353 RepID=UPI001FA7574A|nr:hypothetical protein [Actinomadura terrae]
MSLYNQPTAVELSYGRPGLAAPFEPIDDDQQTVNDLTITREGGSSARSVVEDGPLSVQDPPDGVGVYDASVTLNVARDEQLSDIAAWRTHVGTVDEARYPRLGIKLHKAPALIPAVTELDLGDHVSVSSLPAWLPPDDVHILVEGYTETIELLRWRLDLNAVPESPWRVGLVDDLAHDRVDTGGSELAAAMGAGDTILSVATTSGPTWTSRGEATPIDLMVGGERVRVTTVGKVLTANPFISSSIAGWNGFQATVARSTAVVHAELGAAGSILITPDGVSAGGGGGSDLTGVGTITPGAIYTAMMWAYSPGGWSNILVLVNWHDAGGAFLGSSVGTSHALPAGTWTHIQADFTAPASASQATVWAWHGSTPAASNVWYAWAVRLVPANSTSPQTMTVERSINGVVKAHGAGTDVRLAQPTFIAL